MEQYSLPPFLKNVLKEEVYKKWLQLKAMAHVRRDRKRGFQEISIARYKALIHRAVLESKGKDAYTGKKLNWKLISKYDNGKSKKLRYSYKKRFSNLPTIDHETQNKKSPSFKICSWRINDLKNDLNLEELLEECNNLIAHNRHKRV